MHFFYIYYDHFTKNNFYFSSETDIIVFSVENNADLNPIGEGDTCVGIKYEDPRSGRNVRCRPFCVPKKDLKNLIIIIQKHMEILRMKAYKKKIGNCLGKWDE